MVAARDLEIGTLIKDSDLATSEWVGTLPKGAVVSKENAIGRGVTSHVYQSEPILDSRLAAAGSGGGLAATIRPGMRACAVKVNEVVGVAGFVVPGMRVDVLVSGNGPGVSSRRKARKSKRSCRTLRSCRPAQIFRKITKGSRSRCRWLTF